MRVNVGGIALGIIILNIAKHKQVLSPDFIFLTDWLH